MDGEKGGECATSTSEGATEGQRSSECADPPVARRFRLGKLITTRTARVAVSVRTCRRQSFGVTRQLN